MPQALTYPGVYIEELPSGVHTIMGVATSIAAFVGWADQGPTDQATLVQSWTDFQTQFGGLDSRSYLGYAVQQFFANGGQQAYIVRLVGSGADAPDTAAVAITGLNVDTTETPANVTATTTAGPFANPSSEVGLVISALNPGAWAKDYSITIKPSPAPNYNRFSLAVSYTNPATNLTSLVENYNNLSLSATDGQYVVNIIKEQSNYIAVTMGTTALAMTDNPSSPPAGGSLGYVTISLAGGTDGTVLTPVSSTNSTAGAFEEALLPTGGADPAATPGGIYLLNNVNIFNLLCVPGEADPPTIASLQSYCFTQRAFLIVDCAEYDSVKTLQNGPDSHMTGTNSTNAALYFPWVNVFDPQLGMTRPFPPCGFVAGIYAATDAARGVWKAPAGIDASLTGESSLTVTLTDAQNGTLNPQAINCLRNFRVYGDVIWGARTLQGNDQAGSPWKYVPIRRLALFLETSLYDGTQWVVFEPNDETLWGQIRLNVGSFMQGLFLQGAFQGTTPQQAYFVKCDGENNPQSSIDMGIVNILVGFAPLYPAEFVVIQIQQLAGQLQTT